MNARADAQPTGRPVPALPAALGGERQTIASPAGPLCYYRDAPAASEASGATPLLLVHSINAAACAYEVKPLYERYARSRPVYALDLPGYGHSDRSDRAYTPRTMTDALHALTAEIRRRHGPIPIDALAVSLSCEYLARAAVESPADYRSLALVSPTGFSGRTLRRGPPGGTRSLPWLLRVLQRPAVGPRLFRWLTRPGTIRYFLKRTWGSPRIDEGLSQYDVLTTQQPGAHHAPIHFLSAGLFSADINALYERLALPVWMVHGTRGDFVDYRLKHTVASRPNWHIDVLPTGALPYFELPDRFCAAYEAFGAAQALKASSPTGR
jgi:pimeloyl-ACP methyl ester carboxylesterase